MAIDVGVKGICPHCKISNRFEEAKDSRSYPYRPMVIICGRDDSHYKTLSLCRCTNCGEVIVFFGKNMIHPIGSTRSPCPKEVPATISEDYNEACLVEHLSPKAAAALARRCLQNMLHDKGIKKADLSKEIDEAMKKLPSHLSDAIDAIRRVGNFAAHPTKSKNTGLILDVEKGESEWNLDVIEQLFDFYYVQPANTKLKRDALNSKLKEAGKPELK